MQNRLATCRRHCDQQAPLFCRRSPSAAPLQERLVHPLLRPLHTNGGVEEGDQGGWGAQHCSSFGGAMPPSGLLTPGSPVIHAGSTAPRPLPAILVAKATKPRCSGCLQMRGLRARE